MKKSETKDLNLTFKGLNLETPVKIPSNIIIELKKLSEKSPNIITFQNIEEVLKLGKGKSPESFNYYFVILYLIKNEGNKKGFLIGNVKKMGDILIGIWPFNKELKDNSSDEIISEFNNIIEKPHEYESISLIN